jgi:hypothetical protein
VQSVVSLSVTQTHDVLPPTPSPPPEPSQAASRARPWREPLPEGGIPVARDPKRREVCLLDPATLEPLRFLEEHEEEELGVVRIPVAGTGHRFREASSAEFDPGSPVKLVPEPRNKYDQQAILVRSATSLKVAGYVPAPKAGVRNIQQAVHRLLTQGQVQAMVLEAEDEQGPKNRWVSMRVAATLGQFVLVDRPWAGSELKEFKAAALEAEGVRWPDDRRRLRREVSAAQGPVERHFALQVLAQASYRLRDVHPEALEDAEAACREQILLAEVAGPALRQEFGSKPSHHGYKQLAIILEKRKRYREALEIVEQAKGQGWDGDWERRAERLAKKTCQHQHEAGPQSAVSARQIRPTRSSI